jgi:hypothetical protein
MQFSLDFSVIPVAGQIEQFVPAMQAIMVMECTVMFARLVTAMQLRLICVRELVTQTLSYANAIQDTMVMVQSVHNAKSVMLIPLHLAHALAGFWIQLRARVILGTMVLVLCVQSVALVTSQAQVYPLFLSSSEEINKLAAPPTPHPTHPPPAIPPHPTPPHLVVFQQI